MFQSRATSGRGGYAAGRTITLATTLALIVNTIYSVRSAESIGVNQEAYWIHLATSAVEIVGTAIIVIGAFGSLVVFLIGMVTGRSSRSALTSDFRSSLGRSILLGLEFLVAADIINTVAVEPTIESLLVLAGIVLIRTFLSFSLEVEIDGRWPWQKAGGVDRQGTPPPEV